ncbi:MAG: hypothetical protein JNK15_20535 [Planctomycetes bacterium]|nr:hypothetical protein [Planctomycetota bacterium]
MLRALVFAFVPSVVLAVLPAQNSTRKIRPAPGELAAKVGNAVPWRADVATALREAKEQKKPVFWYVPAVARSPMDRKPEIDRYLRGGPFSWPSTIDLLRAQFVPVAEIAKGDLAKQLGLVRNQFLEPGYVVLDGDGKVLAKVDQITTLHPEWFEAPLRTLVGAKADGFPCAPALREAWQAYRAGDRARAAALADAVLAQQPAAAVAAEAHWLCGAALCRDGRRSEAVARWQRLAQELPDEPLAWKAALEAEGHGPFGHGFEDYLPLPAQALAAPPVDGSRLPGVYSEAELWHRSVAFLCSLDDGDGVVRDSIYDFGGTDSLPNVHAAVTCLVGEALLAAAAAHDGKQRELPAALRTRVEAFLARIRANLQADAWVALSDKDEIVWARAYALRFLAAWQRHRGGADELRPLWRSGVGALVALQPETGVWFLEYGNPFAIATALQALHGARQAGVDVPQENVDRGLRALAMNRTAAGAFTYGHTPNGKPRATVEAAAGRMPLCELGLFLFGGSDAAKLLAAVEAGHRHHGLLAAVRKYDDHADEHGYGGFFFWFDMLARTEAARHLADAKDRARLLQMQRELVLALPEFDGCFVDSHELGRAYGTAMALLCLDACR